MESFFSSLLSLFFVVADEMTIFSRNIINFASKKKILIIFILVYSILGFGFQLSNPILSIDEERGLASTFRYGWMAQGRFGIAIIDRLFLLDEKITPYISDIAALISISVSAFLFCYVLWIAQGFIGRVGRKTKDSSLSEIVFCGLYLTVPHVMGEFMSFSIYSVELGLGLILTAFSIYFSLYFSQHKKLSHFILSSLLMFAALSIYQAFLSVYVTGIICIAWLLVIVPEKSILIRIRSLLFSSVAVILFGTLLYFVVSQLIYLLIVPRDSYLDGYIGWGTHPIKYIFHHLIWNIKGAGLGLYIYGGKIITVSVSIFFTIILAKILFSKNIKFSGLMILLTVGLVLSPFAVPILLGSLGVPGRTLLALPLSLGMMWYLIIIFLSKWRWLKIAAFSVAIMLIWFQIQYLNRMIYTEYVRYQQDLTFSNEVLGEVLRVNNGEIPKIPVYFYGKVAREPRSLGKGYPQFGISFFSIGESYRITSFYQGQGIALTSIKKDQLDLIPALIEDMPNWPAPDSVQKFDDLIIVKFSD